MNVKTGVMMLSLNPRFLFERKLRACALGPGAAFLLLLGGATPSIASDTARIDALEAKIEQLTQEQVLQRSAIDEVLRYFGITG